MTASLVSDRMLKIKIDNIAINTQAQPGKTIDIKVIVSGGNKPLAAVLSLGKQIVSTQSVFLQNGSNKFSLTLPKYLGANNYQLSLRSMSNPKYIFKQCVLTIPAVPTTTARSSKRHSSAK